MRRKPPPDGLQLSLLFDPVQVLIQIEEEGSHVQENGDWWLRIYEHREKMYSAALRMMRCREDAEDVVQNAFLVAHEKREKYKVDTNLRGWLITITRRLAINHYNKEKRRGTEYVEQFDNSQPGGEDLVESFSIVRDMDKLKSEMEKEVRSVTEMSMSGFSHKEISEELKISHAQVVRKLQMGKYILKNGMKSYKTKVA